MIKRYLILIFLFSAITPNYAFATKNIEQAGDVIQILIPAVAYTSTIVLHDKKGQSQFYKSIATNLLVTFSLKNIVSKKRPNGGIHSFPSGHTSTAFQGAAFIHKRYGLLISVPAYLSAAFVGYSRVESKFHFNNDVFMGAAIGIISSFKFTTRYNGIHISPFIQKNTVGIQLNLDI